MLNMFSLLAAFSMLNGSIMFGSSHRHDANVQCKKSKNVVVNSVISSKEDAILLFNSLAGKIDGGKFKDRKYYYDVKYRNSFWTVYGEDITGSKSDREPMGFGGLYLSVDACSGRVVEFKYTR
mgnify:CR=1 FL=1